MLTAAATCFSQAARTRASGVGVGEKFFMRCSFLNTTNSELVIFPSGSQKILVIAGRCIARLGIEIDSPPSPPALQAPSLPNGCEGDNPDFSLLEKGRFCATSFDTNSSRPFITRPANSDSKGSG